LEHGRVTAVEMQGYGACRPEDGCKRARGGGGGESGRPSPPPKITLIECTPNPPSLADPHPGFLEGRADVRRGNPGTDLASITWDFGDGSPSTELPSHEYEAAGTYTVGVVVVAKDGQRTSTSIVVTVTE